jgi:hypothetical protein
MYVKIHSHVHNIFDNNFNVVPYVLFWSDSFYLSSHSNLLNHPWNTLIVSNIWNFHRCSSWEQSFNKATIQELHTMAFLNMFIFTNSNVIYFQTLLALFRRFFNTIIKIILWKCIYRILTVITFQLQIVLNLD